MSSEAVPSRAAAPTAAAPSPFRLHSTAPSLAPAPHAPDHPPYHPLDDYLFCNELLCSEALDSLAPNSALSSPPPAWPCLHHASSSAYSHFCSWSSSPPWSFTSFATTTTSFSSHSCSPSHHDLHINCLQDDHLDARFPPRSCCRLSLSSTASPGSTDLFGGMAHVTDNIHGELEAGRWSAMDHQSLQALDYEPASADCTEAIGVLLERQQRQQCKPLKGYAESMQKSSPRGKTTYGVASGAAYTWPMFRRIAVQCMLEAAKIMQMRVANIAQAVAYLDRYLSTLIEERCHVSTHYDAHVAGVACLWIAVKMEHSNAPDAAVIMQSLASIMCQYSKEDGITALKAMEANVLHVLQWRLLGVSAVEFVDSIICSLASAPAYTSARHLLQLLQSRAHEIVHGTLLEVVFACYEASVVGVCAIQHALEEMWPLQAASILHSIYKTVAPADMEEASKCYKEMGDLVVDPLNSQLANSSPTSHLYPVS